MAVFGNKNVHSGIIRFRKKLFSDVKSYNVCFYNTSVTLLGCTWNKVLSEGRQLLEEADLANLTEVWVALLILLLLCRICVEKYKTVWTNSRSWSLASKKGESKYI